MKKENSNSTQRKTSNKQVILQKQMKEWIPETAEHFQSVMPPIGVAYPEIRIVSDRTKDAVRADLIEKTQSPTKNSNEISVMETLHGVGGNAIIIYQKELNREVWGNNGKELFQHCLWHELGHFYALNMEKPADNYIRFMDQKPHPEEEEAMRGYFFWMEFIAETIACKVTPERTVDWSKYDWYPVRNNLRSFLKGAFNSGTYRLGWYDLSFYFATLLSDKMVLGFLDAAEKGIAKVHSSGDYLLNTKVTFKEAGLEPTGMDGIDEELLPDVKELYKLLRVKISEKEYWSVTYEELVRIGTIIADLSGLMLMNCIPAIMKMLETALKCYAARYHCLRSPVLYQSHRWQE